MYSILTINPGSTSTKVALYEDEHPLFVETIRHSAEEIAAFPRIADQYAFRRDAVLSLLDEHDVHPDSLDAVVGRGGLLRPIPSGTYRVNERMLDELRPEVASLTDEGLRHLDRRQCTYELNRHRTARNSFWTKNEYILFNELLKEV